MIVIFESGALYLAEADLPVPPAKGEIVWLKDGLYMVDGLIWVLAKKKYQAPSATIYPPYVIESLVNTEVDPAEVVEGPDA